MKNSEFNYSLINIEEFPKWENDDYYSFKSSKNPFEIINQRGEEIKDFYFKVFYRSFIEYKLIDIKNSVSYVFILFFHLKDLNYKGELSSKLFSEYCLIIYYSYTHFVFNLYDLPSLLFKNSFHNEGLFILCDSHENIRIKKLFEIELTTGKKSINKDTVLRLVSKDCYTKIGESNFEEVFNIFFKLIEEDIYNLKNKKGFFWDLFLDFSSDIVDPYPDIYYKRFFKNDGRYYKSKKLDRMGLREGDWILKDEKSYYFRRGVEVHPLETSLIRKSVISYLEKQMETSENDFRLKHDLPLIGEENVKWKSENELFMLIKSKFKNENIRQQISPFWLKKQHLDIYFPDRNIGIEYQGIQHYKPIDFFGGKESFKKNQERDKRKKNLCKQNGCNLIYVKEGYDINDVINKINKLISRKVEKINTNYTSKKNPEIIEISSNREIYDCKTRNTITFNEIKNKYPKIQFQDFINRKSVYKRFVLKDKLTESKIPQTWKTIRNNITNEIFRFNKIEFSKHVGTSENNVWGFFNGRQKIFYKTYEIIED